MKNNTRIKVIIGLLAILTASTASGEVPQIDGKVTKVTVYRGQALVTRTIEADLPANSSEIIVGKLPEKILPESIYAQSAGDVRILSVRYREKYIGEDTREEVKKLDQQIEETKTKIHHAEIKKAHFDNQWDMFVKLRQFVADAKQIDTDRGLLQFEPIKNTAEYILTKADEYIEKTLAFEDEIVSLKKELEVLQNKRNEITSATSRTERQAVIFLICDSAKKASIELNYLVGGAIWHQQYNLRANPEKSSVLVEYNAVVNQLSGEDWNNVELSLSTAEPAMVAEPPTLEPMLVMLCPPMSALPPGQPELSLKDKLDQLQRGRKAAGIGGVRANVELNRVAADNQLLIFNTAVRDVRQLQEQMAGIARIEGVSVTYKLDGKLTLPSRIDQQLVTVASIPANAKFYLLAAPILTDYVYLQADLCNRSDTVLLPGPASMFRNGEFVGTGQLPLVTVGENFTTGFGIDSQIQALRELEEKSTRIQGGNQIDTYKYRIALSNYKKSEVNLRLLDRLPYSEDSSIKIELANPDTPLSKDAEYVRTVGKKGILRWDLQLKPETTSEKATVINYTFTTEYDRNMRIRLRTQNP
jgi:uncharacterized protein (TIGR02231 family)